jgi:hypothetical protein
MKDMHRLVSPVGETFDALAKGSVGGTGAGGGGGGGRELTSPPPDKCIVMGCIELFVDVYAICGGAGKNEGEGAGDGTMGPTAFMFVCAGTSSLCDACCCCCCCCSNFCRFTDSIED